MVMAEGVEQPLNATLLSPKFNEPLAHDLCFTLAFHGADGFVRYGSGSHLQHCLRIRGKLLVQRVLPV
jgi:hypothetical protein